MPAKYGWLHMGDSIEFSYSFFSRETYFVLTAHVLIHFAFRREKAVVESSLYDRCYMLVFPCACNYSRCKISLFFLKFLNVLLSSIRPYS